MGRVLEIAGISARARTGENIGLRAIENEDHVMMKLGASACYMTVAEARTFAAQLLTIADRVERNS